MIGTVGAGVIGTGVAQSLAQAGHQVVLVDVTDDALGRARSQITTSVRLSHLLGGGEELPDAATVLEHIRFTMDYGALANCTFIIENVPERRAAKEPVYRDLDRICKPDCVLAANTSCLPIAGLAELTSRPERVIGIHFMNPVPKKRTVELIPSRYTAEATVQAALALLASMGKDAIVVGDSPGFVSNRVLMITINEAISCIAEDLAPAKSIDLLFKRCFSHAMGPLETADLIGLDTVLDSLEVLYESFADSKYRPCPLLSQMVAEGRLGRKSGQGFYRYDEEGTGVGR